jgi:hypothetical protein
LTKIFYQKRSLTHERTAWWKRLTTEQTIHRAVFALLLVGFWSVSAWESLTYLSNKWILVIAGVTLSWGIILLILYVSFKKLGWDWWS